MASDDARFTGRSPARIPVARARTTRAIILIVLIVAGCGSDENAATADLATADLATCAPLPIKGPTTPTRCGPMTCPAGMLCVIITPGAPPPPDLSTPGDGGNGGSVDYNFYDCGAPPTDCDIHPGCICSENALSGCFSSLCQGEPTCRFDGATLTCNGI